MSIAKLKYRLLVLLLVLPIIGLSSCIMDKYEEDPAPDSKPSADGKIFVRLQVNALDVDPNEPRELIHTIRVVMLNEGGIVELNQYEELASPAESYRFETLTLAGKKKFFFIANEKSINCINSDGVNTTPLTEILEEFEQETPGFENAVNDLYFDKSYFENKNNPIPLSSQYTLDVAPGYHDDYQFWLVHTATKYTVHFTNNRTEGVYLNDMFITQLYEQMYVMPHVGTGNMTINGEYWIDWLHKVSDESNLPESNEGDEDFNAKYGWITDYSVPGSSQFNFYLVKNDNIFIDGMQTTAGGEAEPGTKTIGPFYSTEGKNLLAGGIGGEQQYTITLNLTDNKKADDKTTDDNQSDNENGTRADDENTDDNKLEVTLGPRILPNLSALFRNTHVIIYVTFDESYMHIYGEIANWQESNVFGSATEEK